MRSQGNGARRRSGGIKELDRMMLSAKTARGRRETIEWRDTRNINDYWMQFERLLGNFDLQKIIVDASRNRIPTEEITRHSNEKAKIERDDFETEGSTK